MTHTAITRTLVVGYADRTSLPAVDWAVHEAELRSATVCLAGCYHMHVDGHTESVRAAVAEAERLEETTRRELEDVVERVRRSHPRVRFECEAVPGPAHTALSAMTTHADILVLGSHHRDAPHEFWLARTARRTARHSACPLVVVRQPNTPNYLQRIVVGVDGGSASAAALGWASDEASLHGVELVVVHAWMYPYAGMGAHADHAQAVMQAAATNLLDRSVSDARVRCTTTITTELIEAGPAAALLGVVRDRDLLVVGSRGRGPLRSALFGSTVNSLLETSPVSIAVIRDPDTPI